jgi:DNA transposition AAA+ family ATPase
MEQTLKSRTEWQTFITPQFSQIVTALEEAKAKGQTKMLIGETGVGKTYAVTKFFKINPDHTYIITVSDVYLLEDIIQELCQLLAVDFNYITSLRMASYSKKCRIDRIVERLIAIKKEGGKPILIFDESENMNISVLKSIKGLYDRLKDNCAIVLVGTSRLISRMLNSNGRNKGRNREALPELFSRFKAGLRQIVPVTTKDFTPFLDTYVEDRALRKLICQTLESYRDLNTYLLPVMTEAEERNQPLTETLYKLYHDLNF